MTIEPSDQTIILHLLRGAVPERADDISRLWTQYGHAIDVAPSAKGVTMNADASRIQFDTKTSDLDTKRCSRQKVIEQTTNIYCL